MNYDILLLLFDNGIDQLMISSIAVLNRCDHAGPALGIDQERHQAKADDSPPGQKTCEKESKSNGPSTN